MNNSILCRFGIIVFSIFFSAHGCRKYQDIYGFDVSNCQVEQEIDGETRFIQLSCDKWNVQIDYGFGVYSYYSSNSSEDYLRNEKWKLFAIPELKINNDSSEDVYATIDSIKVLSVDDSLNAQLSYLGQLYEHKIVLPEGLADLTEEEKVEGNVSKTLIYNKKTMKTFQYYLINHANVQNGTPEAISIHLILSKPMSLEEVEKLFENVKFP